MNVLGLALPVNDGFASAVAIVIGDVAIREIVVASGCTGNNPDEDKISSSAAGPLRSFGPTPAFCQNCPFWSPALGASPAKFPKYREFIYSCHSLGLFGTGSSTFGEASGSGGPGGGKGSSADGLGGIGACPCFAGAVGFGLRVGFVPPVRAGLTRGSNMPVGDATGSDAGGGDA
jgi:hypothetical protein